MLSKIPTDPSQTTSTSDAPPPKKKSKKNPTKDQHDPDWSWDKSRAGKPIRQHTCMYADLARTDWSRFLSSQYPSSPSLVAAYTSLKGVLAAPNVDSYSPRLTDAILRALNTIHAFLFSAPNPSLDLHTQTALGALSQRNPQHMDSARIAMTSPLLMYLLRIALPTLLRTTQCDDTKSKRQRQRIHPVAIASTDAHTHVDRVLDHLLECLLLPLVRALAPLCFARLAHLVTPSPKKPARPVGKGKSKSKDKDKDKDKHASATSVQPQKHTDTRTDAFALIGTSLEALDALPHLGGCSTRSIAVGIRDRLGLEAIRELESLYAAPPPPNASQPELSQQPPVPPSEPPPLLPTPTPTPLPAQPPSPVQPQPRTQQRTGPESRAKRLERLAGTRAERVRALATRDAGWFLASTLNLCVTPPPAVEGSPHDETAAGRGLLREALLDRIGKLVRSVSTICHDTHDGESDRNHFPADASKPAIDPVCQNMLLAICERTMTHLA